MAETLNAVVEGAFVCDEIRAEANGKLFVIGMYTGSILLDAIPVTIGLTLGFRLYTKSPGRTELRLRALYAGERVMEINVIADTAEGVHSTLLHSPKFGVPIARFENLEFQVTESGTEDWQTFLIMPVDPSPSFSTKESASPSATA